MVKQARLGLGSRLESEHKLKKLKVLFATSEVTPIIKTGGLADVSGALPAALRDIGMDVRVLVPGYNQVMSQADKYKVVAELELTGFPASRLLSGKMANGVTLFILECPSLYQRDGGPYQTLLGEDWPDNAMRFGLLSKVAAVLGSGESPLAWHPDIVQCNDWQTGLTPAYLHFAPDGVPSVIAIHNLAFKGDFPPETVQQLQLPPYSYSVAGVEYFGNMSFLKAGIFYAEHITTVSPNYAQEIQTEELGFGMQGLLTTRSATLTGILNGLDVDEWNPATDTHIAKNYSISNIDSKAENKADLQRRMGLKIDPNIPLLGVVSRFTHQKGLDLLLEIAPELARLPVQLAMLGSGDPVMQKAAQDLAAQYPGLFGVVVGFDESLSHQIEAGADMFIMPSRFEPCGLNQMYSQRYGTPPIVHATGGLADSVVDTTAATLKAGTASGFSFQVMSSDNLYITIKRAVSVYKQKSKWKTLQANCMSKDFSWKPSAEAYRDVYLSVLKRNQL
ncbi:MAG: glycogen synthase GlgA [Gallionella sp.]